MDRKTKTALWLMVPLVFMIALTSYSATLYRMFCAATGFEGTTQRAEALPAAVSDQTVTVSFSADTAPNMPWIFTAETRPLTLKLGAAGHAIFHVKNNSDKPVTGQATYNVLPETVGLYFQKVQCFCFEKHTLQPGEERDFPVLFFVDPTMTDDPETKDVKDITLHYTYFEAK